MEAKVCLKQVMRLAQELEAFIQYRTAGRFVRG